MILVLLIAIFSFGLYHLLRLGTRPSNLPPGPPTEPIFGNLRQLSPFFQEKKFIEWAQKYGPVFTIMKGAVPYIIVNEHNAAHELFIKLGQSSSARPELPLDWIGRGGYSPAMMNGKIWRDARREWHSMLNVTASKKYLPYQVLESTKLLYDMLDTPEDFGKHISRYSNSVSMSMTVGYRVPSSDNPIIGQIIKTFIEVTKFNMQYNWVNFYPFLLKLPSALFSPKRKAQEIFTTYSQSSLPQFRSVQNESVPSFFQVIREHQSTLGLNDTQAAQLAEVLAGAGTETTANTIHAWIAVMAVNPEVQRKAQEEVDRVVGPDRLPRDEDAADLVYVRQMVQEMHRWFTVGPLGLPHAAAKDFEWRGYKIPKGTGLIFNTMAIHHDPNVYTDPDQFIPERWEGKVELATGDQLGASTDLFTFGAGRRICPGQHLAERSVYLAIANWLWAFRIEKAKDESGKEIPIDVKATRPGLARMLLPYQVKVTPRSEARARLIQATWNHMKLEFLGEDEQWSKVPDEVRSVVDKVKSRRKGSE